MPHALLLATGELAWVTVCLVGQLHHVEQLESALLGGVLLLAANGEREHYVVEDCALLEQAEILEDHADSLAQTSQVTALIVRHIDAIDENAPRRGTLEQIDAAHKRGFACARLADDAEDLPLANGKAHIMQGTM